MQKNEIFKHVLLVRQFSMSDLKMFGQFRFDSVVSAVGIPIATGPISTDVYLTCFDVLKSVVRFSMHLNLHSHRQANM